MGGEPVCHVAENTLRFPRLQNFLCFTGGSHGGGNRKQFPRADEQSRAHAADQLAHVRKTGDGRSAGTGIDRFRFVGLFLQCFRFLDVGGGTQLLREFGSDFAGEMLF
ncbi:hypothetical protein SDC9_73239 [bioreactor metagenome]|uniref:Uncharacterized protein n=1 Tax=bioreactor metagenome TaxID=1076179 RepID=A0A644YKU5_9ZZZZ